MLRVLHIKNFSIIDDVNIEFGEGLNVLTGETGAGKSIIIDALSLALGERAASDSVRSGEKEAVIAAFFDVSIDLLNPAAKKFLDDFGVAVEEALILKRIVSLQGKSRAFVNGSMVNVQTLSDISRNIIDVHGQYEHQSLLASSEQLDMLDAYGGLLYERQEVKNIYESICALRQKIDELVRQEGERVRRIDLLDYQTNEIEAAHLQPGESEKIADEMKFLSSAGRLAALSTEAYDSLYASDSACITRLQGILHSLREISEIDGRANEAVRSVENAIPLLEEAGYFLRDYKDAFDHDPARLEQIQERLDLIKDLQRKYGSSISEILEYRERAVRELQELQHASEDLETLKHELEAHRKSLTERAHNLSNKRQTSAKKIESEVVSQLKELAMPDTRFSIAISQEKGDDTVDGFMANPRGIDRVEFLISPNVGEDLKPLSKTASGGELSRIMLALKSILAKGDDIPVLIFDEIDAGIGGRTAETVGQKLRHLASGRQIICITHLPQIASYADTHIRIEKKIKKERTVVEIDKIDKVERTKEIARMLSGEVTDASLKHAKEILKKKKKV